MSETLTIDRLVFEVRRSPRRKTLGLTVDRGGELVLHAPDGSASDELVRWTKSKLLWVHRKLLSRAALAPQLAEPAFVSGENFTFLGRNYRLKLLRDAAAALEFDGTYFLLCVSARAEATKHFKAWYVRKGREWLSRRVQLLSRKVTATPSRVSVRDLGHRWGSCGKNGALYFNWRLLQMPTRVIDYVIVHELAHLREPHHAPAFWRILDGSLHDWRLRAEELKVKARDIYWCHDRMR
ncbi:MAG: metal-dependent hydrolase [Verrucomicrobia bacterium]|nr:MAG: metal-dependent hydrolase [Verrucomicrobiota bacterium]